MDLIVIETLRARARDGDVQALGALGKRLLLGLGTAAAPQVRAIDGFATPAECAWLIALARSGLRRAEVYRQDTAGYTDSGTRTNSEADYTFGNADLVLRLIIERISRASGCATAAPPAMPCCSPTCGPTAPSIMTRCTQVCPPRAVSNGCCRSGSAAGRSMAAPERSLDDASPGQGYSNAMNVLRIQTPCRGPVTGLPGRGWWWRPS